MKKLLLLFAAGITLCVPAAKAQTAEEIVNKYVQAVGGEAAWKKVNSITAKGSIAAPAATVDMTLITLNGKGFRTDYSVMGMSGYQIITPTAGWYLNPGEESDKPQPIPEEMVKASVDQLDAQGALIDYKMKGHKVEYLGKETIDGKECHKLKLNYKSGKEETWFITADKYELAATEGTLKGSSEEQKSRTTYTDFKTLPEGIVYPMTIKTERGDIKLSTVEINKPVDEKIFAPAG